MKIPLRSGDQRKFIDYSFRIGGIRKFIVEAKEPSVKIRDDDEAALQFRRYAWNAKSPPLHPHEFRRICGLRLHEEPLLTDNASDSRK